MSYGYQTQVDPLGRYCMYLRKSRADLEAEAFGKFETLAAHRAALEALADRLGIRIDKVFQEIASGETIKEREQMVALLHEIRNGKWDGVLVYEVERLARGDLQDQATVARTVQHSGTFVITPMKIYDPANEQDMEFIEFGFLKARSEFRTTNRRLAAGRLRFVERGNYIGAWAPYGYDLVEGKRTRTLQANDNAKYVKYIFDRYEAGDSPTDIAVALDGCKAPVPRRVDHWAPHTVRYILRNIAYKGWVGYSKRKTETELDENFEPKKVQHNNHDYPKFKGLHDGIVSEDQFDRVQKLLQLKSTPPSKSYEIAHPFAGLMYCKKCGYAMRYVTLYYTDGTPYDRAQHKIRNYCGCKSCKTDKVIDAVIEAVKSKVADFDVMEAEDTDTPLLTWESKGKSLEEAKERIEGKLRFVFQAYEDGDYTREDFLFRKAALTKEREEIVAALVNHELERPVKPDYDRMRATFHSVIDRLADPDVSGKEKNKALKQIIRRIDYWNDGERYKGDNITLDIFFLDL